MFNRFSMPQPHAPRATRYPLHLPVRFRPDGEDRWSFGVSLNISHTGILFQASLGGGMEGPLDIEVVLPGDDEGSARIVTRGVVRRAITRADEGEDALAVSLSGPELIRVLACETR